jgi:uncharacterized membrane protein
MDFITRFFRHLFATHWNTQKKFPIDALKRIEQEIAKSEVNHSGQIRFIVETSLSPLALWHRQSAQARALEVFSLFHIWDTEENNGVLLYLLMADRDFEIVADRNINAKAGNAYWLKISKEMEIFLKNNQFEEGVMHGIAKITEALREHFPEDVITPNELSDTPLII